MTSSRTRKKFLDTSRSIGLKICEEAIWYNDRCNWIGGFEQWNSDSSIHGENILTMESLGPDMYGGISGIAYFLSKLYAITREDIFRDTAYGAIQNALHQFNKFHHSNFGFYTGKIGVLFSAVNVGKEIKNQQIIDQAYDLLIKLTKTIPKYHMFDVISGNAGAIPPLLSLYDFFGDPRILDLSIKLGSELISISTKEKIGLSWGHKTNGIDNIDHNLTGYSHGAAGIGHGLIELYRTTGERKFLHAGKQAFEYEDHWFNPQYNNWPDFRITNNEYGDQQKTSNYSVGWCHGSPGIGLTRLHSYDLLKEDKYLRDSKAALSSSKNVLLSNYKLHFDYSLCHGLGGIAEIFIFASVILKKKSLKNLADKIGLYGIETYAKESSWPYGIQQGQSLGLMLGLSGIGYFYLRLYDPNSIPSILIITR